MPTPFTGAISDLVQKINDWNPLNSRFNYNTGLYHIGPATPTPAPQPGYNEHFEQQPRFIPSQLVEPSKARLASNDRDDINAMLGQSPETGFLQNKPAPSPTPTPKPTKRNSQYAA